MCPTSEWIRRYERFWGDRLDILESRLLAEDEIAANCERPTVVVTWPFVDIGCAISPT